MPGEAVNTLPDTAYMFGKCYLVSSWGVVVVLISELTICFSLIPKSRSFIIPQGLLEPPFLTLGICSFQALVIYLREAPLVISHLK